MFPFPTNKDFGLNSIITNATSRKPAGSATAGDGAEECRTREFTSPGGTAVWGAFAYTISPSAYRTLVYNVGLLLRKGKRMQAYQKKPIDKILPRDVGAVFGHEGVHLPDRIGPILGSLLHERWETGFYGGTKWQLWILYGRKDGGGAPPANPGDGAEAWDRVWLIGEEWQTVNHRRNSGKWVRKGDIAAVS